MRTLGPSRPDFCLFLVDQIQWTWIRSCTQLKAEVIIFYHIFFFIFHILALLDVDDYLRERGILNKNFHSGENKRNSYNAILPTLYEI